MKNIFTAIIYSVLAAAFLTACQPHLEPVGFSIDKDMITVGAEGGTETVRLNSSGSWYAEITGYEGKETPWISVSPMNGTGSVDCQVSIDTTLLAKDVRQGNIRFYSEGQHIDLKVNQTGFENIIHVEQTEYEIPEYAAYGKRSITLEITANVQFKLDVDQGAFYDEDGAEVEKSDEWITEPDFKFELDRESRPRTIRINVDWQGNSKPYIRKGSILIEPVETVDGNPSAEVHITQGKAPKIENNRTGDSLAIVSIARSLGFNMSLYEGEKMSNWDFVTFWQEKDAELAEQIHNSHERNCKDEDGNPIPFDIENYIGRVRSVQFKSFDTKDELPAEIQYLTTLESLMIYGNGNAFLKNFTTGEYVASLTQLKNLQIYSYGLSEVSDDIENLVNLERLDLSGNNFNEYPSVINAQNFPKLKYLDLAANRRRVLFDMTTTTIPKENWGGFSYGGEIPSGRTGTFPVEVLGFPEMEYLALSNNYIIGELPDVEEIERVLGGPLPKWEAAEIAANDTLQSAKPEVWNLEGKPKILPKCRYAFFINLNLLEGKAPDWLLFHPFLMNWAPDMMVFNQDYDTLNMEGEKPGFTNIPADPNYYYEVYPLTKPEEFE